MSLKRQLYTLSPYGYRVVDRVYASSSLAVRRQRRAAADSAVSAELEARKELILLQALFDDPLVVQAGPFTGMKYLRQPRFSRYAAKILGVYEAEIHSWLEMICQKDIRSVINIGCAEGYYAVGLARRLPKAKILGVDIDVGMEASLKELAQANSVTGRIRFATTFDPHLADVALEGTSLLIVDIEGSEVELFASASLIESLRDTIILVEIHDQFRPGVEERIRRLFHATHTIDCRRPYRYPKIEPTIAERIRPNQALVRAVTEDRCVDTGWLLLSPYSMDSGFMM